MIENGTTLQQRYKIDKQIGQGGMGAVYVATDQRFGSLVAIKETLCMDDNYRKAIEREARLLNSLKHIALPRVSDHFEEDNGMFLVMEYIPGEDLCCVLDERGEPFPVDEMLKWGDQLLDALDFLHNQEVPVIHRDIKPQNLKLTPKGQVILLDFGLAKGNPSDVSHQTAAKSIFGYSRSYASLEQIQGTGTDPRSDLYSLAATLYHLMTTVAPEDALTRAMSVLAQKPDPLLPANQVNPLIPRGVAGVLQKALALNASDRPSSANEMRQMLRESENYAYLTDNVTMSSARTEAHIFAQPTKLMAEGTRADAAKQTDMKTEVLPGNVSDATVARPAGFEAGTNPTPAHLTSVAPQKGRGMGVAAGALMMLLVGVIIAGGVYFVKPSVFGLNTDSEKAADPGASVPAATDTTTANARADSNSNPAQADGAAPAGQTDSPQVLTENIRPADPDKPAETNKTKPTGSSKANTTSDDLGDVVDIQVDDPEIPRGGVILTDRDENGKVTTMRVMPANPQPPNMQRMPNGVPPPYRIDPKNMTPAQRQKLMRLMKNNPQLRPIPMPTPEKPKN